MNNCTMIGRMTKDPTPRTVVINGVETPVLNFYIAVDDGLGDNKKTDFVKATAWRGAAEAIAKYMTKGREIAVAGAVHLESYAAKDASGHDVLRTTMAMPRPYAFEFLGKRIVNETTDDDCPFPEDE